MLTAIILGLLALGAFTAAVILAWTISALADWVFGLFKDKDSDVNAGIEIGGDVLTEVVGSIREKNPGMAERMEGALGMNGAKPKKLFVWQKKDGSVAEATTLEARDASTDELGDLMRFTRDGKIRQY